LLFFVSEQDGECIEFTIVLFVCARYHFFFGAVVKIFHYLTLRRVSSCISKESKLKQSLCNIILCIITFLFFGKKDWIFNTRFLISGFHNSQKHKKNTATFLCIHWNLFFGFHCRKPTVPFSGPPKLFCPVELFQYFLYW